MAKAKSAVRPAAKKASKGKSGAGKRKRRGGGMIEGRPIIIKGGALPGQDVNDEGYTVLMEAEYPADYTYMPPSAYPNQYSYVDTLVPEITTLKVYVDGEMVLDQKVEGSEWQVFLETD